MSDLIPYPAAEPARWITERVGPSFLLPSGFDVYVRVLHPFEGPGGELVTWASLASIVGQELTPFTSSDDLTAATWVDGEENKLGDFGPPMSGQIPYSVLSPLTDLLKRNTTTPESCYFAIWEGWSGLSAVHRTGAAFTTPARRWFLHQGPITAGLEGSDDETGRFPMPPNLWWPADNQWYVETEVDFSCTYVGCNEATAHDLLNSQLETLVVPYGSPLFG